MLINDSKKLGYYKKEAKSILNIPVKSINKLIKEGKLRLHPITEKTSLITIDSVFEYKKELEERKSMGKPVWVNRNDY